MRMPADKKPSVLIMIVVAVVTFVTTLAMFWNDAG